MSGDASSPFCYLTTTGRSSGNPQRIEIWFALHERVVYLLSGGRERSDWVRNLEANPEVILELGRERRVTRARVLDPRGTEGGLARRLLLEKYQPGYGDDLSEWGRTSLPVAVDWADPA